MDCLSPVQEREVSFLKSFRRPCILARGAYATQNCDRMKRSTTYPRSNEPAYIHASMSKNGLSMTRGFVQAANVADAINKALGRPAGQPSEESKEIHAFLEWAVRDVLVVHKGKLGHFNFTSAVSTGRTLFVGEGNLSFALALTKLVPNSALHVVATTFESLRQGTPATQQNATRLAAAGAKVLHGIDATRLDTHFGAMKFHNIVFNFPNVASRVPIYGHNPNHHLVRRFLRSASKQLVPGGRAVITTVDSPFYSGAFGLPEAAKFAGFKMPEVYNFKPSHFSGYAHANTLGGNSVLEKYRSFRTWVFQLP